jgi:signal transduction histidine kinase
MEAGFCGLPYEIRAAVIPEVVMNKVKRTTILYRFLRFVLPLTIVSILITSVIISSTSYKNFLRTVNQDYSNIIMSASGEIRLYMEDARKGLAGLAWILSSTKLDPWQEEIALTAFHHTAPEFMSLSLVSLDGKETVRVGRELEGMAFAQDEAYEEALAGRNAVSGVMLSKENIPYVHIAAPVISLGRVRVVLLGVLNLKSVWNVLQGINIGRTGQVYVMDLSSGRLIGHREIDRVIRALPAAEPQVLAKLREAGLAPVQWTEATDKGSAYCLGYTIPDLQWVVVLSQMDREIYSYVYENIQWAVAATLIISFFAALLGWRQVKRFLTPIHALHGQVRKIGKGDLDDKISVESKDEIGDLSEAFNEMTDSLKGFIAREVETAKELVHAKNLAILGMTSSKVTHEVGNLLNNLGLVLHTLRKEKLTPCGARAIEILERDSDRVQRFIHDFLQFAKKPELELHRLDLGGVLGELLNVHGPQAEEKGIQIDLLWPPDLPPVNVDPIMISQVFNNLVKNAVEAFSGPGTITVEGSVGGGCLRIVVKDTGPGIPQDMLGRIFDPFFTTKGKKGTGLGLSICKTIVEAHRGTIECRSESGGGTTFVIDLPFR